jgi:hypothetical protein
MIDHIYPLGQCRKIMKLITEPFDHEEQDRALVEALTKTDNTRVYLDTSALVWLYRIRRQARGEFVDFLEAPALRERSHIPLWSLHELNKHRRTKTALFPLSEQHNLLSNAMQNVVTNAHLFVDDKFASGTKWKTGADFIDALMESVEALEAVLAPLRTPGKVAEIDTELQSFLHSHALEQPMPALAGLKEEFLARCEGRLPPGYEDSGKGGRDGAASDYSGANRFGDYVFWRSVVEHAKSDAAIRTVVIISHDAKPDWVHRPDTIVGYGAKRSQTKKEKGGRKTRVTCPQPVLSFEIRVEAGVERLFIVSIEQLVLAFSLTGAGAELRELARAIQIESDDADAPAAEGSDDTGGANSDAVDAREVAPAGETVDPLPVPDAVDGGEVAAGGPGGGEMPGQLGGVQGPAAEQPHVPPEPDPVTARIEALAPAAFADGDYVADATGAPEADAIVEALKSYNWYTQNPAVLQLRKLLKDPRVSDLQLFILGRNLYQAACGSAWRASDMLTHLDTLAANGDADTIGILFAGCLFEAYYDHTSALRHRPKSDFIDTLFAHAQIAAFAPAVHWLRARLAQAANRYVLLPGDDGRMAVFALDFDGEKVEEIRVHGVSVTEPAEPDADGWDSRALSGKTSHDQLTSDLASDFAIPEDRIVIEPAIEGKISLAHLRLVAWGPHSDIVFPAP